MSKPTHVPLLNPLASSTATSSNPHPMIHSRMVFGQVPCTYLIACQLHTTRGLEEVLSRESQNHNIIKPPRPDAHRCGIQRSELLLMPMKEKTSSLHRPRAELPFDHPNNRLRTIRRHPPVVTHGPSQVDPMRR